MGLWSQITTSSGDPGDDDAVSDWSSRLGLFGVIATVVATFIADATRNINGAFASLFILFLVSGALIIFAIIREMRRDALFAKKHPSE
ncbi:hypothetical protein HQ524_02440 [Candidatus Uhrbacteria bacterium]|nr:hypothetical protein [Candidatus Uhrbacteria bacterium]